jgi:hypothetical protein
VKVILAGLAALLVIAGAATSADAATKKKRGQAYAHDQPRKSHAPRTYGYRRGQAEARSNSSDYYEHVLDSVPFGSQRWWSIYHEQHGTPW